MSIKPIHESTYNWNKKEPIFAFGHYSHSRIIYIGTPKEQKEAQWVVKIANSKIRRSRIELDLPHAEEVAYKVCKLFEWDVVPKSKVFHQESLCFLSSLKKTQKYVALSTSFDFILGSKTYTFQTFVEGVPLSSFADGPSLDPDPISYQKIYLLGMILGNFDSRDDNIIYDPKTKKLFSVDNEYLGKRYYNYRGVLNRFDHLKQNEIDRSVLDTVCRVTPEMFDTIGQKYRIRGGHLLQLWDKERDTLPPNFERSERQEISKQNHWRGDREAIAEPDDTLTSIDNCWATIMKNFRILQREINIIRESGETITLANLEHKTSIVYFHERASTEKDDLQFSDLFG